jgi:mRNA-degrading endonuclease toxin of MazEF toxin-antitoxin module
MADLLQAGRRPVLVVSRESLNRGRYVTVVAFTTGRLGERRGQPNCVPFRETEFGLTADCVAQCETIASIPVSQLDTAGGAIGELDAMTLRTVVKAIGFVIESDCEPT